MLFFVSVGMLFDPMVIVEQPLHVLATVAVIIRGQDPGGRGCWCWRWAIPARTALVVAASLAQVGEFSFILAGLGMALGLLPKEGNSLILAGALISIALNPLVFSAVQPTLRWLQRHPKLANRLEHAANPLAELPMSTDAKYLAHQVVLVGWGRVGKLIAKALTEKGIPFVVAESNRESVEALRAKGIPAVWGDATEPMVLIQAHIREARALVIATPETIQVRKMVETARTLNPNISVVVRSHNVEEAARLEKDGSGTVFVGETELAKSMVGHVLGLVVPSAVAGH